MNSAAHPNKIHEGRNVKRFREMLGIKQDALAYELGRACPEHSEGTWNQQKISLLEQKETIDAAILKEVAAALKIPVEAIQNFDEEQAVNVIANTFSDFKDGASAINIHPVFNPIEAVLKIHDEKMALYERMLKEKDEMMAKLEQLIEKK